MGAAKGVARQQDAVETGRGERRQGNFRRETRGPAAHGAGNFSVAQRGQGDRQLHQPAAAERVAEAALPRHERRTGKLACVALGLEPPGLERARAVALNPDAPAANRAGDRRQAGGEAGTIRLVAGEMKHLVVQRVGREAERTGGAAEHRERRAITEPDRAGLAHRVRRGQAGVEDLQAVKTAGDERADEIKTKHEHAVSKSRVQQACGVHEPEMRRHARVREHLHVFAPAQLLP